MADRPARDVQTEHHSRRRGARRVAVRAATTTALFAVLAALVETASAQPASGGNPYRIGEAGEPPPAAVPEERGEGPPTDGEQAEEEDEPRRWETPVRAVPRNVVSFYPWSLVNRGAEFGYERALSDARFTLGGRIGASFPASYDFSSRHFLVAAEARFYAIPRGPFTRFEGRAPVGLFLGVRAGVTRVVLESDANGRIGQYNRVGVATLLGYRLTIRGRVELSTYLGALFYADFHSFFPPTLRPTLTAGFSIGALF